MIDLFLGLTLAALPEIINHPESLSLADVSAVCRERVEVAELPCATVEIDDKVCFAFLNENGESSTVHCFRKRTYNL